MQRLEEIRRRIESAGSLQAVSRAMKALAAARIRRCRETAQAAAEYERTLELGFQIALSHRPSGFTPTAPPAGAPLGAVVFGSDLGLAGPFNSRVADFALTELAAAPARDAPLVLAVGTRVANHLEAGDVPVVDTLMAPSSVDRLGALAQDVLLVIQRWRREQGVERVDLLFAEHESGAGFEPRRLQLLPLDPDWLRELERRPWTGPTLPTHRGEWESLFSGLVREHLYLALYRAAADSMASEHASRLAAMEQATGRIEDHLEELRRTLRTERQEAVTQELLEVASGYEALREPEA